MRVIPILMLLVVLAAPAVAQDPLPPETSLVPFERGAHPLVDKAMAFVDLLVDGRFDDTADRMDAMMNRSIPPRRLEQFWTSLEAQVGRFNRVIDATFTEQATYRIVELTAEFENAAFIIRVAYDDAERVSGFVVVPTSLAEPSDPPYADRTKFMEEETTVVSGNVQLPGTLAIPMRGRIYPVVVFVHGSGPQDRDETIGPNKVFRDLAWGLATLGVASLRYEKRTKHAPEKLNVRTLTYREETVDDALAALELVENDPRFERNRVVLLGHSFGGTLAPLIASESDAVDAVVLMAATTERMTDAILRQMEYVFREDGALSETESAQLDATANAIQALEEEGKTMSLLGGVTKRYVDALDAYDERVTAQSLEIPVFVAQGARDYQVLADTSYADWQAALADHPDATFKLYPLLDHLFMPGAGRSYPSDYQDPRNVAEEFIRDLAEWIEGLDR